MPPAARGQGAGDHQAACAAGVYNSHLGQQKNHAEVIGLLGYTVGKGIVVNSLEELSLFPQYEKVLGGPDNPKTIINAKIFPGRPEECRERKFVDTDLRIHPPTPAGGADQKVDAIVVVEGRREAEAPAAWPRFPRKQGSPPFISKRKRISIWKPCLPLQL